MLAYLIYFFTLFSLSLGELDYDGKLQIRLEHALSDNLIPAYQFRGDVSIKSLHSGSVSMDQIQLTSSETAALVDLAKKDEIYRLKVTVKTPDNKQNTFHTFTSACALLESSLADILYIHLDHVGNVVAVSMATQSPCSYSGKFPATDGAFLTSVYVRHMDLGPVPDTASYVQKLERDREAQDRGEAKDNRSFLAKYWMYIVPVVLFVLLSSASQPEGGGGQ